ncbi:hypothetical protein F5B20DRAFT_65606 [Whalleya microplaca]|nr:hypothetical protein F5B20DRAFT_65606 [Whalleya microplaca]
MSKSLPLTPLDDNRGPAQVSPLESPSHSPSRSDSTLFNTSVSNPNTTSIHPDNSILEGGGHESLQQARNSRNAPTEVPLYSTQAGSYGHSDMGANPFQGDSLLSNRPESANNEELTNNISKSSKAKLSQASESMSWWWWWWWEILAMILSITCMCILITLLARIDNLPLQSWWLPI